MMLLSLDHHSVGKVLYPAHDGVDTLILDIVETSHYDDIHGPLIMTIVHSPSQLQVLDSSARNCVPVDVELVTLISPS